MRGRIHRKARLEQQKSKKSMVRVEKNQATLGWSGEKKRKAGLEVRKTKKSWDRAQENQEKR